MEPQNERFTKKLIGKIWQNFGCVKWGCVLSFGEWFSEFSFPVYIQAPSLVPLFLFIWISNAISAVACLKNLELSKKRRTNRITYGRMITIFRVPRSGKLYPVINVAHLTAKGGDEKWMITTTSAKKYTKLVVLSIIEAKIGSQYKCKCII